MPFHTAPGITVVRWYARLVPTEHRERWVAEWQAELAHAYHRRTQSGDAGWLVYLRLLARAFLSLPDALWMRRHRGGGGFMTGATQDVRLAGRLVRRRPGFALLFAATIAVGTGAAIAIFAVVDAVALRPSPYPEADRLAFVRGVSRTTGGAIPSLPLDFVRQWAAQDRLFERAEFQFSRSVTLAGSVEPRHVGVALTTPGLLGMLGARPQLGRLFVADDARPDATPTLILADDVWRRHFGARPDVIGSQVLMDGVAHVIVGVLDSRYVDPVERVRFWRVWPGPTAADVAENTRVAMLVKTRGEIARETVAREADALAAVWNREQPRPRGALWNVSLRYLDAPIVSVAARRAVWVLGGASLGLLLIVCANAANLLLVGGAARLGELGIRRALGASRLRLLRQLMIETALLTAAGAGGGLLLAIATVGALRQQLPPALSLFLQAPLAVDGRVLAFALLLTFAVTLLAGISPALTMSATDTPRGGASRNATGSRTQATVRRTIVVGQLAVSVMLIAGAALLVNTLLRLTRVDPGVDADRILTVDLYVTAARYPTPQARDDFFTAVAQRARLIPGVRGVTVASAMPPGAGFHTDVRLQAEGTQAIAAQPPMLPFFEVDTAFFGTLGIPILQGRGFTTEDRLGAPDVAVIDPRLAAQLWPGASPIGKRFRVSQGSRWLTVVGVAGDMRARGADDRDGTYELYTAVMQNAAGGGNYRVVGLRTDGDPRALGARVREAVRAGDPSQPIESIMPLTERYAEELDQPRFMARIIALFGFTALLLAGVGTFGVLSFAVSQRRREIGIRMALGARGADVMSGVMREGLGLAAAGVVVGLLAAMAAGRLLESMLFGVTPHDPLTMAVAAMIVLFTSALAVLVPARRASRVDPAVAMSAE